MAFACDPGWITALRIASIPGPGAADRERPANRCPLISPSLLMSQHWSRLDARRRAGVDTSSGRSRSLPRPTSPSWSPSENGLGQHTACTRVRAQPLAVAVAGYSTVTSSDGRWAARAFARIPLIVATKPSFTPLCTPCRRLLRAVFDTARATRTYASRSNPARKSCVSSH